ncbi:MAG: helix-turn-helix domain-containing protein [Alphaproteobacteria bacterium]|nr:helix-turn-helix domain-containing protein [Alphaproteobacteria bacterium]
MHYPDLPQRIGAPAATQRCVAMLCFPNAQIIDVTGPLSVFATASEMLTPTGSEKTAYSLTVLATRNGQIATSCGLQIVPDQLLGDSDPSDIDTLIVAGGQGVRDAIKDKTLIAWLRNAASRVRRIASVCTGAYLLAEAGLLDGRRATTHWRYCDALAQAYPAIDVEPDAIHVKDGNVYSSAGVTAGMDLALALVEEDYDRTLALAVARDKVMFLKRPGGQSQFSAALAAQSDEEGAFGKLQQWILDNLGAELSVPALADHIAMSPRNFARVFAQRTGMTPAKFVEAARLESSRRRLEDSAAPIEGIAHECGFGNAERLRKAFQRRFRITPQDYRRRFHVSAAN